jgi:hypothetical protein
VRTLKVAAPAAQHHHHSQQQSTHRQQHPHNGEHLEGGHTGSSSPPPWLVLNGILLPLGARRGMPSHQKAGLGLTPILANSTVSSGTPLLQSSLLVGGSISLSRAALGRTLPVHFAGGIGPHTTCTLCRRHWAAHYLYTLQAACERCNHPTPPQLHPRSPFAPISPPHYCRFCAPRLLSGGDTARL